MRFCKNCSRAMIRDTSSGAVLFRCPCGVEEPGGPEDARIGGAILGAGETTEMYDRLIQTAPFDRTNQLVRRLCPDCNRDYMTQIRVGDAEVIIYKCKCGHGEVGEAPLASETGAPAGAREGATGAGPTVIHTQEPWFGELLAGRKKVEARVGKLERYAALAGEYVVVQAGPAHFDALVTAVRHYPTLRLYLEGEGWEEAAPHTASEREAEAAYLAVQDKQGRPVYADGTVRERGGVVALELHKL